MATLSQIYTMRSDSDLRNRAAASIAQFAYYIVTTEDPGVANHANRLTWAKETLQKDPNGVADSIIWSILQNTDIQTGMLAANLSDATLQSVVEIVAAQVLIPTA